MALLHKWRFIHPPKSDQLIGQLSARLLCCVHQS